MDETGKEYIIRVNTLFKKYGIKSVTMDDVSRELGISKKTLYTFFKDKSDLVEQVLKLEFEEKSCSLKESMSNKANALEELFEYYKLQIKMLSSQKLNFIYDLKKYYPSLFEKFNFYKKELMFDRVKENLIRGKDEGLYRKDLNEDIISRLHIARIESLRNSDLFSHDELISPTFFAEAFKYHVYAIVSNKGREIINENIDKLIENA
jgi:AcrR family transcriptional regulator